MPKRTDISTVLIIGAGPIVIGQACEFDYSGTQACKALKEEGYRVVLVNSNPATIMTDPDMADATYIEPITPEIVAKIIEKERHAIPGGFALLPTMGGQTALNTALSLRKLGVLDKHDVEMIGATADAIDKAEDRERFREAMTRIGLDTPRSHHVKTLSAALQALDDIGLPAIIRPSFTMGGTGGGIAYNKAEFIDIVESGIDASPTSEVLIEESVLGWKEFEMEVVRDKNDNCIIICSIENIDPMGVHTGDSITVAPALTLTDKEYQMMRDASIAVLREIGVETGGSNVQFAVNPEDGRLIVIEMNPRGLAARFIDNPQIEVQSPEQVADLPNESLDLISMISVVQYLSPIEFDALLAMFRRVLKPDGRLLIADVIPPFVSPVTDAAALLKFAITNGFLLPALAGLVRTALSDYRDLRIRLGLTHYSEDEMTARLAAAGFSAQRQPRNVGHNSARMTFLTRRG